MALTQAKDKAFKGLLIHFDGFFGVSQGLVNAGEIVLSRQRVRVGGTELFGQTAYRSFEEGCGEVIHFRVEVALSEVVAGSQSVRVVDSELGFAEVQQLFIGFNCVLWRIKFPAYRGKVVLHYERFRITVASSRLRRPYRVLQAFFGFRYLAGVKTGQPEVAQSPRPFRSRRRAKTRRDDSAVSVRKRMVCSE